MAGQVVTFGDMGDGHEAVDQTVHPFHHRGNAGDPGTQGRGKLSQVRGDVQLVNALDHLQRIVELVRHRPGELLGGTQVGSLDFQPHLLFSLLMTGEIHPHRGFNGMPRRAAEDIRRQEDRQILGDPHPVEVGQRAIEHREQHHGDPDGQPKRETETEKCVARHGEQDKPNLHRNVRFHRNPVVH